MSESRDRPGSAERPPQDRVAASTSDGAEQADGGARQADLEERPPREATCPYLRLAAPDGALSRPRDVVTEGHACIAMGETAPLSDRQQALVCLTSSHQDCPRYLRATLVVPITEPVLATRRRIHPATLVATVLLALSTVLAVAFTAARGGIAMPASSTTPGPSEATAASPTPPASSSTASTSPVPSPSPAASPSPSPSAAPSPSPLRSPSPTPSPKPTPSPSPTPQPTSDRYELLVACPDKPDCWIYTVRSGDNLVSIANYFGVPLAVVYDRNPWVRTTGLRAGQELILPPPTR